MFETEVDTVDENDKLSGDPKHKLTKYKKLERPYLISAGIVHKVLTMAPLMVSEAYTVTLHMTTYKLVYPYILMQ